jgi:hypothetical protein
VSVSASALVHGIATLRATTTDIVRAIATTVIYLESDRHSRSPSITHPSVSASQLRTLFATSTESDHLEAATAMHRPHYWIRKSAELRGVATIPERQVGTRGHNTVIGIGPRLIDHRDVKSKTMLGDHVRLQTTR